jgi:uncharacterized phage-associated protein
MSKDKKSCPYLPAHIANYFLSVAEDENIKDVTPMKLTKLVYFSYAWYRAIFGKKLFEEKIEAWRYGPVVSSVYHEFKRFGNNQVTQYAVDSELETGEISYPVITKEDPEVVQVVSAIWKIYKGYSGQRLSDITHEDKSPWRFAYAQGQNTVINDDDIIKRAKEAILKYADSSNE